MGVYWQPRGELMRRIIGLASVGAALGAGALSSSAAAAPLVFDCDTPQGNSSSVSSPAGPAVRIATVLRAVALRPGKATPSAGVLLTSADGKNAFGFQLVLPIAGAAALQLAMVGRSDSKPIRQVLAKLPLNAAVDFAMQVDDAGRGHIRFGSQLAPLTIANLGVGRVTVYCGAGQFRFENLEIAAL
jgi:hypothetical protein